MKSGDREQGNTAPDRAAGSAAKHPAPRTTGQRARKADGRTTEHTASALADERTAKRRVAPEADGRTAGQRAPGPASGQAAYTVTATSLNVRAAPDARSARLGALRHGERITGAAAARGWLAITFEGRPAFVSARYVTAAPEGPNERRRSGADWVGIADACGWVNSTEFSALDARWGPRAEAFVLGLRAAGAPVHVEAGLRHPNRACLMHFAWGVARGTCTPARANAACRERGIDIEWDHGNLAASRAAAQALVSAFGLVRQASLKSNHIRGLAIDIEISSLPARITLNGRTYTARRGASGPAAAASVAPIGRDMGVIWFGAGDYVHWSHNGR